jgi:hypothetical protein
VATRGDGKWFAALARVVVECRRLGHGDVAESTAKTIALAWNGATELPSEAFVAASEAISTLMHAGRAHLASTLLSLVEQAPAKRMEPVAAAHLHVMRSLRGQMIDHDPSALPTHLGPAAQCYEAAFDTRNACVMRANLGYGLLLIGEQSEAIRTLTEAMTTATQLRLTTLVALCKHNLGLALAREGRIAEGQIHEQFAIDTFVLANDSRLEAAARCYAAHISLLAGDAELAEEEARRALGRAQQPTPARAMVLSVLSEALLARRRSSEALKVAIQASDLVRGLGGLHEGEEGVRLALAKALWAERETDRARRAISEGERLILERASRIQRDDWRSSYLSKVPENAQTMRLAAEWTR